jgi:hypothetical protein
VPAESNIQSELEAHYRAVHQRLWGAPGPPLSALRSDAIRLARAIGLPAPAKSQGRAGVTTLSDEWRRRDTEIGPAHLSWGAVLEVSAAYFHMPVNMILARRRGSRRDRALAAVCYLGTDLLHLSNTKLGQRLSRDRTTVLVGIQRARIRISLDASFAAEIDEIKALLQRGN